MAYSSILGGDTAPEQPSGREAELLHRFAPERYPRPADEAKAGQIRGIAVVAH